VQAITAPASAASIDAATTPIPDASITAAGSGDVAPADLFSEGAEPTCPAASLEDLGTCLLAHSLCGVRMSELERDKVPDVALQRAVATGCEDVYLVVKRGSMWRAIKYVLYLQGHGRRNTDLTLKSIRDTRRASGRVTEIVYHVVDDVTEIHDEKMSDNHREYDTTLSCTWPPDGGEPSCR